MIFGQQVTKIHTMVYTNLNNISIVFYKSVSLRHTLVAFISKE